MTVEELFSQLLARMGEQKPACNILDAVRGAQSIIVNRLLLRRSKLIQDTLLLQVATGADHVDLPNEFRGVAELPSLTGRWRLFPVDTLRTATMFTETGPPRYYEEQGKTLYLFPTADSDYEVRLPAFVAPVTITALSENLPFSGQLDNVFAEAAYGVLMAGVTAIADRGFAALIESQVDQAIQAVTLMDEQVMADSINYGALNY